MDAAQSQDSSQATSTEDSGQGSVDLSQVNALQQAVAQRAREAEDRRHWLPRISRTQWIVSLVVAAVMVLLIFRAVDKGLTALQMFFDAASTPAESPPAAAAPEVDVTAPLPIIIVPITPPTTEEE